MSLTLLSSIIVSFILAPVCLAIPEPTERFYVNDYANILSDETEDFIFDSGVKLHDATTAQIVVVTVPNLEGKDLENYATELFRKFGIGDKEKNNGLLLLLALEERQFRAQTGYGLEGALPDSKCGRLQREYMIPYFKENNWDEGMTNGYKAFFNEVAAEYNYNGDMDPEKVGKDEDDFDLSFLIMVVIFAVFLFIINGSPAAGASVGGSHGTGGFFGGGSSGGGGGGFSGGGGDTGGGGASSSF